MSDLAIVVVTDEENPVAGDFLLVDGQLVIVSGIEAIRQDLTICLRWFREEWFLDRRAGVPWFESVLGLKNAPDIIERLFRRIILGRPGVTTIKAFGLDFTVERDLVISFTAGTTDGDVTFSDFVIELEPTEVG